MATWVATYIDRLISYWCGQIMSRIYIYIYIITDKFIERTKKYAYIIAYDCWENGLWNITWIIITPDTNLSVPIPYMTAAYRNIPYHLDGPYGPAHVAGPFDPLSLECCPTRIVVTCKRARCKRYHNEPSWWRSFSLDLIARLDQPISIFSR